MKLTKSIASAILLASTFTTVFSSRAIANTALKGITQYKVIGSSDFVKCHGNSGSGPSGGSSCNDIKEGDMVNVAHRLQEFVWSEKDKKYFRCKGSVDTQDLQCDEIDKKKLPDGWQTKVLPASTPAPLPSAPPPPPPPLSPSPAPAPEPAPEPAPDEPLSLTSPLPSQETETISITQSEEVASTFASSSYEIGPSSTTPLQETVSSSGSPIQESASTSDLPLQGTVPYSAFLSQEIASSSTSLLEDIVHSATVFSQIAALPSPISLLSQVTVSASALQLQEASISSTTISQETGQPYTVLSQETGSASILSLLETSSSLTATSQIASISQSQETRLSSAVPSSQMASYSIAKETGSSLVPSVTPSQTALTFTPPSQDTDLASTTLSQTASTFTASSQETVLSSSLSLTREIIRTLSFQAPEPTPSSLSPLQELSLDLPSTRPSSPAPAGPEPQPLPPSDPVNPAPQAATYPNGPSEKFKQLRDKFENSVNNAAKEGLRNNKNKPPGSQGNSGKMTPKIQEQINKFNEKFDQDLNISDPQNVIGRPPKSSSLQQKIDFFNNEIPSSWRPSPRPIPGKLDPNGQLIKPFRDKLDAQDALMRAKKAALDAGVSEAKLDAGLKCVADAAMPEALPAAEDIISQGRAELKQIAEDVVHAEKALENVSTEVSKIIPDNPELLDLFDNDAKKVLRPVDLGVGFLEEGWEGVDGVLSDFFDFFKGDGEDPELKATGSEPPSVEHPDPKAPENKYSSAEHPTPKTPENKPTKGDGEHPVSEAPKNGPLEENGAPGPSSQVEDASVDHHSGIADLSVPQPNLDAPVDDPQSHILESSLLDPSEAPRTQTPENTSADHSDAPHSEAPHSEAPHLDTPHSDTPFPEAPQPPEELDPPNSPAQKSPIKIDPKDPPRPIDWEVPSVLSSINLSDKVPGWVWGLAGLVTTGVTWEIVCHKFPNYPVCALFFQHQSASVMGSSSSIEISEVPTLLVSPTSSETVQMSFPSSSGADLVSTSVLYTWTTIMTNPTSTLTPTTWTPTVDVASPSYTEISSSSTSVLVAPDTTLASTTMPILTATPILDIPPFSSSLEVSSVSKVSNTHTSSALAPYLTFSNSTRSSISPPDMQSSSFPTSTLRAVNTTSSVRDSPSVPTLAWTTIITISTAPRNPPSPVSEPESTSFPLLETAATTASSTAKGRWQTVIISSTSTLIRQCTPLPDPPGAGGYPKGRWDSCGYTNPFFSEPQ